jgi:hypothetical protein
MLHRLDAESRRMVRFQDSSGIISCSWVAFGIAIMRSGLNPESCILYDRIRDRL